MAVDSRFGLGLRAEDKSRSRERDRKASLAEETERKYCLLKTEAKQECKALQMCKKLQGRGRKCFFLSVCHGQKEMS